MDNENAKDIAVLQNEIPHIKEGINRIESHTKEQTEVSKEILKALTKHNSEIVRLNINQNEQEKKISLIQSSLDKHGEKLNELNMSTLKNRMYLVLASVGGGTVGAVALPKLGGIPAILASLFRGF